jgi:hypothetical protein
VRGEERDTGVGSGAEQRVEDGVGVVGGWEEFPGVFALEFDAALAEELDGLRHVEAAEDFLDGVAAAAGVGGFVDGVVGDVAAPAAGDEDFGTEFGGAVEGEDGTRSLTLGAR